MYMFKSIAWKAAYGAVAAIIAGLNSWIEVSPDPQAWTLTAVVGAVSVALVAAGKKLLVNVVPLLWK